MMNPFVQRGERGVALLVAVFALLLLSVIGLGMMYSTNMESAINSNYRDKQVSIYAALGGLQEARDRLQPAAPTIALPDALPSLTAPKVIYIVSDSSVQPWDPSNRYFDTELCHLGVLGLTAIPNAPCTTMVSTANTAWRQVVDDSDSANAPWNLLHPLDAKWTRVVLKANNMTPVAVNGNSADGNQVCFDGTHQVALPTGYGATCGPNGSIILTLLTTGTGYTPNPTVTISAPPAGGVQATADAVLQFISNGQVASVTVTSPGTGYTSTPTVVFTGDGSGAAGTALVSVYGSPVQSLSLTSVGTKCYGTAPTVSISGGGGSGATATAALDMTTSCVYSWTPSGSCTSNHGSHAALTGIGLTGGGGSGFSGGFTVAANGKTIVSGTQTIADPGIGYTGTPATPLTNITACTGPTAVVGMGHRLGSITLTSGGTGYLTTPTVSIATGTGTAATAPSATATLGPLDPSPGQLLSVNLTASGTGYTTPPTVTFVGGSGSGASATATLGVTRNLTGLTLTNAGAGYLTDPTVTITDPTGSGATAKARIAHGAFYGHTYLLTTLAETRSGARSMAQMELGDRMRGFTAAGALILDGPNPSVDMPNSLPLIVNGNDANSCGETPEDVHPAVGGYDDFDADPPTHSVQTIIDEIPAGRTGNYIGSGGTPSVENVFGSLGETMGTTTGMKALIDAVHAQAALEGHVYGNDPGSIALGTATSPVIDYVEGNLTLNGNNHGYGVLVVSGTLTMGGFFNWSGIVLVVGDGIADLGGGGNGQIRGTVWIAKIWDNFTNKNLLTTLGSPAVSWNGGGSNEILYDHCWATNMISRIPFLPPPSTKPLKILSFRMLPY